MIRLETDIKNFTNIFHIGDVHIRLTRRHAEFLEVFDKLYLEIDKTPKETIILVAGDLFHNKADLSAEAVNMAGNFLKTLADKRPTILIAGNHDAMLTNRNRLDSLSPVVNALNHKNLYYLKESELYILGDVLFNNYSVFTDADKYIKFKDIPSKYLNETNYNIALYHGPVNSALTDVGYVVSSRTIMTDTFDGHQMVLLGDIHKQQTLQAFNDFEGKPIIAYCGSLLQQDHGEDLIGHGYLYWTLKNKSFVHTEVPNDYGFYTVEVNNGKLLTDTTNIPKKAKLRIKCFESVPTEIKSVLSDIKKLSDVTDVTYIKMESDDASKNVVDTATLNLHNLSDVSYQNQLIKEYFDKKGIKLEDSALEGIYTLNTELNAELKKEHVIRNIRWKPKILEFDNMFSYGEGNIIDFTKMNGIMGLFARNAQGKSSINSILTFCLFDKCERSHKASHLLNTQKMNFRCKFNFEINGVDFFIERKGVADKKGNVKVDVKFWKMDGDKVVELNGEARRGTNDIIRDYIGEYQDFILTTLSIQNGKDGSFVDMGQTERKDLLAQFMGLNIFDNLSNIASEKYKEIGILLKNFNNTDYTDELNSLVNGIMTYQKNISDENVLLQEIEVKKSKNQEDVLELTKQLKPIDSAYTDINELERRKSIIETYIKTNFPLKDVYTKSIQDCSINLENSNNSIQLVKDKDLEGNFRKYESEKFNLTSSKNGIDRKKLIIKNKLEKLDKLKEHKYDKNCQFCIDNVFVKDAIRTKEELIVDENELSILESTLAEIESKINDLSWVVDEKSRYDSLLTSNRKLKDDLSKCTNDLLKIEQNLLKGETELENIKNSILNFYKQKDDIEHNKLINYQIENFKLEGKDIEQIYKSKNRNVMELNSKLQNYINRKQNIDDNIKKIADLEVKNSYYTNYIQAINRDGIPYELITLALPSVEREVNNILHQIVDFTVKLKTDGKNVSTYIVYDDKSWPLELSSGMEKFVSSLAIRVALINISNLPRPTFMVIDEGFSALDTENIQTMATLFAFLKSQFDFIVIISHVDVMKDMVDKQIEIKKENGFSNVVFN